MITFSSVLFVLYYVIGVLFYSLVPGALNGEWMTCCVVKWRLLFWGNHLYHAIFGESLRIVCVICVLCPYTIKWTLTWFSSRGDRKLLQWEHTWKYDETRRRKSIRGKAVWCLLLRHRHVDHRSRVREIPAASLHISHFWCTFKDASSHTHWPRGIHFIMCLPIPDFAHPHWLSWHQMWVQGLTNLTITIQLAAQSLTAFICVHSRVRRHGPQHPRHATIHRVLRALCHYRGRPFPRLDLLLYRRLPRCQWRGCAYVDIYCTRS